MLQTYRNTKNVLLASLVLVSSLIGLNIFLAPVANAAATCYRETAALQVEPSTHTCPSQGTYVDTSGVPVTNYNAGTRCFVATTGESRQASLTYREQTCSALETLRTNAARDACTNSGGEWKLSPALRKNICACPEGTTLRASGACRETESNSDDPEVVEPSFVKNDCNGDNITAGASEESGNHCGILDYLVLFINILSALVGVIVVGSIIYGGIQYSTAGSDPQKVAAAKARIRNAIIALIFFIFTYSFLNYLVPGGVL